MSQPDPHQGHFDALLWRALVFNHIHEAMVVTAGDETILDWNAGAERIFGWSREEVLGQPLQALQQPLGAAGSNGALEAIVQRVGRWQGDVRLTRKDGSTAACEVVGIPLLDADDRARGTLFVYAETAPAEASGTEPILEATPATLAVTQQLRDERFLLRKLIDAVPDPIFCKDREGRYLLRNAADLKMFEAQNNGSSLGKSVYDLAGLRATPTSTTRTT
ncbi:MAG: PAS domain-containing protein [Chthoniobacter sp.]